MFNKKIFLKISSLSRTTKIPVPSAYPAVCRIQREPDLFNFIYIETYTFNWTIYYTIKYYPFLQHCLK